MINRIRTWFRRRQEARILRFRLRHYLKQIDSQGDGMVMIDPGEGSK